MKIKNIKNVETFLEVVNGCKGEMTLWVVQKILMSECVEK